MPLHKTESGQRLLGVVTMTLGTASVTSYTSVAQEWLYEMRREEISDPRTCKVYTAISRKGYRRRNYILQQPRTRPRDPNLILRENHRTRGPTLERKRQN